MARFPAGRRWAGIARLQRPAVTGPRLETSVEDRDRVMPQPAQHPPEARGNRSVGLVVGDDLGIVADPDRTQPGGESVRRRQRMAAGVRSNGRRQVSIEVGVARSGDMRPQVRLAPGLRVHEIETAVNDGQPRLAQQFLQGMHVDQGLERHESELSAPM
jgi:hypothetical protein